LLSTYWAFEPTGGQERLGEPNLVALIPPEQDYMKTGDRRGLLIVTLGCEHKFTDKLLGNCYHEYKCQKCTYGYRVDSGD
jgi:hypothetical protein